MTSPAESAAAAAARRPLRVACFLLTPKGYGGAETALRLTADGLRELGCEVDVLALSRRDGAEWSPQCASFVDRAVDTRTESLESALSADKYDGVVLSDTYFVDPAVTAVFAKSAAVAPWTAGRHWNSVSETVQQRHTTAAASPKWSRSYVSFWRSAEDAWPEPEVRWERAVLPWRPVPALHGLPPVPERPVDFGFVGATGPLKGVVAFVSALDRLQRTRPGEKWSAEIAGAPNEQPGGPHIHGVSLLLEKRGWRVDRETDKLKTKWVATAPSGSELVYSGAYSAGDLPDVFGRVKCYANLTTGVVAPNHLEYATMEAMEAGCLVLAPDDWDSSQYAPGRAPRVKPVPAQSHVIRRGARVLHNDTSPGAPDGTYGPLGDLFAGALRFLRGDPASVAASTAATAEWNRSVLAEAHDPLFAARAYLRALGLDPGGSAPLS